MASKRLEPDKEMLKILIENGINENLGKKALICCKNESIEKVVTWITELGAEEMEALGQQLKSGLENSSDSSSNWEDCEEDVEYKMVFVVNTSLKMGVGKIAAQAGHATLGLYKLLKREPEKYLSALQDWDETGERKIALKAVDAEHLLLIRDEAQERNLPFYIVQDAGKTQIASGSMTVLSIFGDEDLVDQVTGKLKLL